MTPLEGDSPCALCGRPATGTVEPPRRTLARGSDPNDGSYSVTIVLPDLSLCAEDASRYRAGNVVIGWCDDEQCQSYGETGTPSPCGKEYEKLLPSRPQCDSSK